MAIAKSTDRSKAFRQFDERAIKDVDPENDDFGFDDQDPDAESQEDTAPQSREHYEKVGKSKLRKGDATLGPQYRGSKVSRDAMLEDASDDEDDPFSKDFDDEDSEDADMDELEDGEEEYESGAETEDTEMSDEPTLPAPAIDRAELRRVMANEKTSVVSTITAAQKADAEKGRAVIQQRAVFDALLNARIKLQKSLIATNSLVALEQSQLQELKDEQDGAVSKAEEAALNLWNSLSAFREQLDKTGNSKSTTASISTSTEKLVKQLSTQEQNAKTQRNAVLQKWSMKSRGVTATAQSGRLNTEQPATIVDVLNEHMASSDRLLKKARTPRSCAPVQLAARKNEDEHIYDDADFYGLLLKELLEAKSSATAAAATNVDLTNFANMRREAKTKRHVDTKASKGRKLRYTVHEKLQNYCAPEDRTTWSARQTEELFSSLFGLQSNLNEDRQVDEDEVEDVEMDGADNDLRLFS